MEFCFVDGGPWYRVTSIRESKCEGEKKGSLEMTIPGYVVLFFFGDVFCLGVLVSIM